MKHPHYPDIDFKPAIAEIDWDQTHDVLRFNYLPAGFGRVAGIPCYPVMAIHRFSPYKYRWAEQYSDKVYYFCKTFNFSPHNSIEKRLLKDQDDYYFFDLTGHPQYQGEWQENQNYNIGDVVEWQGNYYQALTLINPPVALPYPWVVNNIISHGDSAYWRVMRYYHSDLISKKFLYARYEGQLYLSLVDSPVGGFENNPTEWLKIGVVIPEFVPSKQPNNKPILAKFKEGYYEITMIIDEREQPATRGSAVTLSQAFWSFSLEKEEIIDIQKLIKHFCEDDSGIRFFCANSVVISRKENNILVDYTPEFEEEPLWLLYNDINQYFSNITNELINYFQVMFEFYKQYYRRVFFKPYYNYNNIIQYIPKIPNVLPLQGFLKNIGVNYFIDMGTSKELPENYNYYSIGDWLLDNPKESTGFLAIAGSLGYGDGSNIEISDFFIDYDLFPAFLRNDCFLNRANNNWVKTANNVYSDLGNVPDYVHFKGVNEYNLYLESMGQFGLEKEEYKTLERAINQSFVEGLINTLEYKEFLQENSFLPSNIEEYYSFNFPTNAYLNYFILPMQISCIVNLETNPYNNYLFFVNNSENLTQWSSNIGFINNYNYGYLKQIKKDNFRYKIVEGSNSFTSDKYNYLIGTTLTVRIQNPNSGNIRTDIVNHCLTFTQNKREQTLPYFFKETSNLFDYKITDLQIFDKITSSASQEFIEFTMPGLTDYLYDYMGINEINYNFKPFHYENMLFYSQVLFTENEWQNLKNYERENYGYTGQEAIDYLLVKKELTEQNMVDSIKVQEIHAALGASQYAYYTDPNGVIKPVVYNIARRLEELAEAFGISFYLNGDIKPIRQRKNIPFQNIVDKTTEEVTTPDGYPIGQFGINIADGEPFDPNDFSKQNGGIKDEPRLGIVYQNRCNKFDLEKIDPVTNLISDPLNAINNGDFVLCENLIQYVESLLDDLDKALNWQEMGGACLPNINDDLDPENKEDDYCRFEGLGTLIAEVAFSLSKIAKDIAQIHILSLKNNGVGHELLKATGLPLTLNGVPISLNNEDCYAYYPGLAYDAPSLTRQNFWVLQQLGALLGKDAVDVGNLAKTVENAKKVDAQKESKFKTRLEDAEPYDPNNPDPLCKSFIITEEGKGFCLEKWNSLEEKAAYYGQIYIAPPI